MKKVIFSALGIFFLIFLLTGCSKKQEYVSIEIWHYYNGAHKVAFDRLVREFNEKVGLEKGIIVEAFNQGDIAHLEENIIESVEEKVGASKPPNILAAYPELAYTLDQRNLLVNLDDYMTDKEISEYVDSYIEEGRLGDNRSLKIFPIAKATEIMMINKTDWDKFAVATGATIDELKTWEGIARTAELYYDWTDSLTEEKNDGKAFFGRDALANYMLVGAKQLGKDILHIEDGKAVLNLDQEIMRKLWDHYYIPYIKGHYTSYGRFSSDDAKIGEIIALVGSSTGLVYFPNHVTIEDEKSYPIESLILPLPNFKNTKARAIQQGAGMVVLQSEKEKHKAAVEFLKWFTEPSRNMRFSVDTGYLPVKKEKKSFLAIDQLEEYESHINKAFENGSKVREVLEQSLENKAKTDRDKVVDLINQGITYQEAIAQFETDENFENWLLKLQINLMKAVK